MPRLQPPLKSVPVTGRSIAHTRDEYATLTAPDSVHAAYSEARAAELYRINCAVCHGQSMTGDGAIVSFLKTGAKPPNLVAGAVDTASEGDVFGWVSFGGQAGFALAMAGRETSAIMPQFYQLLTEQERWSLVLYLKKTAADQ
jgi:mono/diheme cytochrome c family protein